MCGPWSSLVIQRMLGRARRLVGRERLRSGRHAPAMQQHRRSIATATDSRALIGVSFRSALLVADAAAAGLGPRLPAASCSGTSTRCAAAPARRSSCLLHVGVARPGRRRSVISRGSLCQVEQFPVVDVRPVEANQLVAIGHDAVVRAHVMRRRDTRSSDSRTPCASRPASCPPARGTQAAALHLGGNRHAGRVEKRLGEVDVRHQIVVHAARLASRPASGPAAACAATPRRSSACRTSRARPGRSPGRRHRRRSCCRPAPRRRGTRAAGRRFRRRP